MKECTKCGVQKSTADFYSDSQKKDGLSSACKECKKAQNNLYTKSNKEQKSKYDKMYRDRNNVEIKKRKKEYSDSHKEEKKEYDKSYNAVPLNKVRRYKRGKEYREKNPDRISAILAAYRASKLNQTPELTDEEKLQIIEIYKEAIALRKTTGDAYHVDHIIPISKGGLHHPLNLQVITAFENQSKGNRCDINEVSKELLALHDKHYGCNFLEYSTISSKGTGLK